MGPLNNPAVISFYKKSSARRLKYASLCSGPARSMVRGIDSARYRPAQQAKTSLQIIRHRHQRKIQRIAGQAAITREGVTHLHHPGPRMLDESSHLRAGGVVGLLFHAQFLLPAHPLIGDVIGDAALGQSFPTL